MLRVLRVWGGTAACSAALLTVASKDVSVSGCDASPTSTAQPHRLQLGGVRPAAGAGAFERLFEHRAEGDEGVRASGVAAVALAARQQHHLQNRMQKTTQSQPQSGFHQLQRLSGMRKISLSTVKQCRFWPNKEPSVCSLSLSDLQL